MLARMWRKRKISSLLVKLQTDRTTLEINLAVPQNTEISSTWKSSYTSPGQIPPNTPTYNKDTCSILLVATLFIIARSWKQLRCSSEEEESIQKICCIYTVEYYSASKNNDFMKFLGKWMELKNIILREVTKKHTWYALTDKWIWAQKSQNIHDITHIPYGA